jgi:hypothetical protein
MFNGVLILILYNLVIIAFKFVVRMSPLKMLTKIKIILYITISFTNNTYNGNYSKVYSK